MYGIKVYYVRYAAGTGAYLPWTVMPVDTSLVAYTDNVAVLIAARNVYTAQLKLVIHCSQPYNYILFHILVFNNCELEYLKFFNINFK